MQNQHLIKIRNLGNRALVIGLQTNAAQDGQRCLASQNLSDSLARFL